MKTSRTFILGACLLAVEFIVTSEALFNVTSNLLRSSQAFNLTISDSCTANYTVDFGDSTPAVTLSQERKIVSHSYATVGTYKITVQSSGGVPSAEGCQTAEQSMDVREPIVNMTASLNGTWCRLGEHLNLTVTVTPVSPVTGYWRFNRSDNWTKAPVECKEVGEKQLFVLAENGISVSITECLPKITVTDFDFVAEPGAAFSPIKITRTGLTGVADESNYTFVWDFGDGEIKNCPNLTVTKSFNESNIDPGYLVTLRIYDKNGHSAKLEKYVKIHRPLETPIQVSYKNITGKNTPTEFTVLPHKGNDVTYQWDFGDHSTIQNTSNRTITYVYSAAGVYCVVLTAKNVISELPVTFKVSVLSPVGGLSFVSKITPAQTGTSTRIGVEVRNGSNFNVSVNYGDGSPSVMISKVDEVSNSFVISLRHNYSSPGKYNVSVRAWNALNTETISSIAMVQDPVWNLTFQKTFPTKCLEVNGTMSVLLAVHGSEPSYYINFGDGKNATSNESRVNHSYLTYGNYYLNITAFNDVSSVSRNTEVTVCKPVIPISHLKVTASPAKISDPVTFTLSMAEGSDIECSFEFGDDTFEYFGTSCFNKTYFANGVTSDKTPFMNLEFTMYHNYSNVGRYEVNVYCLNRLSSENVTLYSFVQRPIEGLQINPLSPVIVGSFAVNWTMTNGTNVTFQLDIQGTSTSYSSFKTDMGDSATINVNKAGVFVVSLNAKNLVSESNHSIELVVQDDVTEVTFKTWTTSSDWGSGIPGLGKDSNTFPCEYPVKFTATPNKGTNLTYWWKFGDGTDLNTSEATHEHKFSESEPRKEYRTEVTVFNLVSSVTETFTLRVETSVLGLAITDNSPVKVIYPTKFHLSFSRYGYRTCVTVNMGDGVGMFALGVPECQKLHHKFINITDWTTPSITFSHNYTTIGTFNVTVNATNTVSRKLLHFKSVTSALSCFYPNASILDIGANLSLARKVKRSESVLIQTKNDIDCEASKSTSFRWEVYSISRDPKEFQQLSPEELVRTGDQPYIQISATSLYFGFYKLVFTVKMNDVVGIFGSAEGFIHVVATQDSLLPAIDGGPRKRFKFGSVITMNSSTSVDQDYANITEGNPEYYWLCRNISNPEFDTNLSAIPFVTVPEVVTGYMEDRGGCFGTGTGRLPILGAVGEIDTRRGMRENATYVITLVLITHNPFFVKKHSVNQIGVVVPGDPPEVAVACTQTCPEKVNIDQKLSLRGACVVCFGKLRFKWELYRHNGSNVDPTDTSKVVKVRNLEEMSTTSIDTLNLVVKADMLPADTYHTAIFKAIRPSGQFGEYLHTFITNSPPENGTCDVTPKNGSAMYTLFAINCSDWEDADLPLTYEFAYESFNKESVFFIGDTPFVNSVYLPMGHEESDFNLTLKIRIIDRLGAATTLRILIKVYRPPLVGEGSISLSDIVEGDDGLLKGALSSGDLKETVQIVSSVSSILNFMERQDEQEEQGGNLNEEATKSKEKREEFRREILHDLNSFSVETVGQVKMLASAVDAITEAPKELIAESQELAFSSLNQMTSLLETTAKGTTGFVVVKEAGTSLISAIGNVAVSSARSAEFGSNETEGTDGIVSAKNRTLKLDRLIDIVSSSIMEKILAGDVPLEVNTRFCNLTVKKSLLQDLGQQLISNDKAKFSLPTLDEMGLSYEPNGTEKYSSINVKLTSFPNNTFTWSETSKDVKSFAVGLTMKDEQQNPLDTSNFSEYVNVYIPRDTSKLSDLEEFNLVPFKDDEFIQYHTIKVDSLKYSLHFQIIPVNESKEMQVFLRYSYRPTPDNFDYNWTLPDFGNCSFKNASRNESDPTAGTTTPKEQVVIDVAKDCTRDPYTASVSNSLITRTGTYYLAVHYKVPDSAKQSEEGPHSSTNSKRQRREIPLACRGASGRMKRSCVIIPAPPPKPTTPSKIREGTIPANVDFQGNIFNPNTTERYRLRVFSSNCIFWNETTNSWMNEGCKVGDETSPARIHCQCNHLTSFASDFLVAPNPIDFGKVFSADLSKNPVVLIVVCLMFGLYFILVLIARRYDKKDLEKLGATAIQNRGDAVFPYLISVHTGVRQNAGTTSSIYIVLSGDQWQSSPMALVDPDRKVFQRGQENNFVIALPRSLGEITHIRIWHDNSGKNASWYLSRISVDDLRTEERWYFICERWLAVEEDDGRVERVLPVASDKELTHFQHLFVSKTVRELGDGHLWFSVITRPATSPFTRVQRISCCLSLLCLTMVTNAMFYDLGNKEATMMVSVGSFQLDFRTFIIGLQASLIIFPVNLALVQIFRSVRPKKPKQRTYEEAGDDTNYFSDISRCSSMESLPKAFSKKCFIEKEDDAKAEGEQRGKDKKKRKGLPHFFVYFAWVLCFLASVSGAVFTVFYSLNWGAEISNKWLVAFLTSFVQSILVIQPVKVVFASLLFALIIRKPLDSNEDPSEKKELKEGADGQETGTDVMRNYEDNDILGPPDDAFLKSARKLRLKEMRMSEILKEILAYFMFVFFLLVVAYGNKDPHTHLLHKNMRDIFVAVDQTGVELSTATDVDLFFHWSRETLVPNLYPGVLYNNKTDKYTGFIDDRYNYLVGISRFRQARVKKDSCVITEDLRGVFSDCLAEYSVFNEDKDDYDVGWKYLNKTSTTNSRRRRSVEEQFAFRNRSKHETLRKFGDATRIRSRRAIVPVYTSTSGRQQRKKKPSGDTAKTYFVLDAAVLSDGSIVSCPTRWLHRSALELRGFPFVGHMALYGGGGYPADLGYDYPTALTVIADLHSHNWVDKQTRAVFVEFTVYNANVNLFGIAYLFLEFLPTGGAFPTAHFAVSRLYSYVGPFNRFMLACQVLLILFMFYFMYREGRAIYKQRKAYFHGFFNWMEVITVICEFAMVILYLARWWQVDKNLISLRHNPKDFVSFQYAGAADETLTVIMGLLVFLVTLRFLKLFRFNRRMSLIGSTLKECAKPLLSFLVSFMLLFLGYAVLAFLVFGVSNENFKNFLSTFETQTSIILGDFDYRNLEETNRLIGPFYFFSFMYFSVFYLLNMFMAIINDSFAEVKASNDKQQNEYEMVEFILSKFKESLGLSRNRIGTSKSPFGDKSSGFPDSPPFSPSDYKFRENEEDFLLTSSQTRLPQHRGKNVLRAMAALKNNLDQLNLLLERRTQNELEDTQLLLDVLDSVKIHGHSSADSFSTNL